MKQSIKRYLSLAPGNDSIRQAVGGGEERGFAVQSKFLCRVGERGQCVVAMAARIRHGKRVKLPFGNLENTYPRGQTEFSVHAEPTVRTWDQMPAP